MADVLIRLLVKTRSTGYLCKGCGAAIDWYRTLADKAMPMNAGAKPTRLDDAGRVGFFAAGDAHWSRCPQAKRFARGRR